MPSKKGKKSGGVKRSAMPRMENPFVGRRFSPGYDPPPYNKTPEYNLVVPFEDPYSAGTAYFLGPANVRARVLQMFGITANSAPNLVFRMKRFRMWAVADASSASVALDCDLSSPRPTVSDDASPSAPRAVYYGKVANLVDTGTLNKPAAVGWTYSLADQSQIISPDQTFYLAQYSAGGNGFIRILVDIAFSFSGVMAPPTVAAAASITSFEDLNLDDEEVEPSP
jgi:hypothetical protein